MYELQHVLTRPCRAGVSGGSVTRRGLRAGDELFVGAWYNTLYHSVNLVRKVMSMRYQTRCSEVFHAPLGLHIVSCLRRGLPCEPASYSTSCLHRSNWVIHSHAKSMLLRKIFSYSASSFATWTYKTSFYRLSTEL